MQFHVFLFIKVQKKSNGEYDRTIQIRMRQLWLGHKEENRISSINLVLKSHILTDDRKLGVLLKQQP